MGSPAARAAPSALAPPCSPSPPWTSSAAPSRGSSATPPLRAAQGILWPACTRWKCTPGYCTNFGRSPALEKGASAREKNIPWHTNTEDAELVYLSPRDPLRADSAVAGATPVTSQADGPGRHPPRAARRARRAQRPLRATPRPPHAAPVLGPGPGSNTAAQGEKSWSLQTEIRWCLSSDPVPGSISGTKPCFPYSRLAHFRDPGPTRTTTHRAFSGVRGGTRTRPLPLAPGGSVVLAPGRAPRIQREL